jgi:hypothetical protein
METPAGGVDDVAALDGLSGASGEHVRAAGGTDLQTPLRKLQLMLASREGRNELLRRALSSVMYFRYLKTYVLTPGTVNPASAPAATPYECRFGDRETLLRLAGAPGLTAAFVNAALDKGDLCFLVMDGPRLAGYSWYSTSPTTFDSRHDRLTLSCGSEYLYSYKGFTVPEYRGQRVHALGKLRVIEEAARRGYRGLVSYVDFDNYRSIRSLERVGYRNFGRVVIVGARGRFLIGHSPGCARCGFRISLGKA